MKRSILLATCAGAAIALSSQAFAQSLPMNWTAPYIEFGGGLDSFTPTLSGVTTDFSPTPPVVGVTSSTPGLGGNLHAAVGVFLMPDVRGEVGVNLTNGSSTFTVQAEGVGTVGVNAHTFSVMANFWKDFELANNFGIHVGGGLGVGVVQATSTSGGVSTTLNKAGLALMGGIGGDYHLTNGMTVSLDYRASGVFGASPLGSVPITTDWIGEHAAGTVGTTIDQAVTLSLRIPIGG